MKLVTALCALACLAMGLAPSAFAASQQRGYMLRDTSSLPPPAAGQARLLVARDMVIRQDMKPEFVFVDRTPAGMLPQRSAVTIEVPAGWHRVWPGRGSSVGVWMEFVPDGRYLLRLRETAVSGAWRGDLVRENREGYAEFALSKGMKLAVMDDAGKGALERNLKSPSKSQLKQDSLALTQAKANAVLPIVIQEAWYLSLPSDAHPGEWQNNPGTLTLDEKSLRFVRADTLVVEIPRHRVTPGNF